ncbi:hypothetical protein ACF1G0_12680 [Streptomyces sp. NPDC013953]|uniref:hypothetical protein n=1 Tax=Streptomyces sp. NPDC013953 TaxID=3364868 RepID=UPI0036F73B86
MTPSETSRYVRLRVELTLEITDTGELTAAALDRIDADAFMPDDERTHARAAVREDEAEALAYLVEPDDLLGDLPGTDLVQASWTSEQVEYDPEAGEWDLDDDEDEDESAEADEEERV